MRLFVALPLPPALRRALATHCETLRRNLPAARWVAEENLHLTVRFLGEVEATRLEAVRQALERAVEGCSPFELVVGERGCFPPRGRPRVLWVGVEPERALSDLQTAVSRRLEEALGLEPENRPFHPHVTVARCREDWGKVAAQQWRRVPFEGDGTVFGVTYVDLMESRLAPSGATHHRLDRYGLNAAS